MITRGLVLSMSAAMLLAVLPGAATQADTVVVGFSASAVDHPPGTPASTDAWRRLTYATAEGSELSDVIEASATLAATPPAGETVTVTWVLGKPQADRCEVLWQTSETFATLGPGNTVSAERSLPAGLVAARPSCFEAVLSTSAAARTDVLEGYVSDLVTPAGAEARPAGRLRLVPGRTTPAILMVTSHARATSRVVVTASGAAVSMRPVEVGPLAAGEVRPVLARFRVTSPGASRVALTARDDWSSTTFDGRERYAARAAAPKRPLPGRYALADGRLAFRVRPDFTITRLRAPITCGASTPHRAHFPEELRFPRGGVAADVARSGDEWFGAQLMADRPYQVRVAFGYSSPTCSGSVDFFALHQSVLDRGRAPSGG